MRGALVTFCFLESFPVDFCAPAAVSCLAGLPAVRFLFLPATSVEADPADLGGLPRGLPDLPAGVVLFLTVDDLGLGLVVTGAVDLAGLP